MNEMNTPIWKYDPTRGADWRWVRATVILENKERLGSGDDLATCEIVRYRRELARRRRGISKAIRRRWPDLAAAHGLHQDDGGGEIQARLLAGESFGEIAAKTGVAAPVIAAYESTFFAVADALHAGDWLVNNVLRTREWAPGTLTPAQTWQWVGIAAGPAAMDILVAEDLGRPKPVIPDRAELAAKLRFAVVDAVTPMTALDSANILDKLNNVLGPEDFQGLLERHPSLGSAMRMIWAAAAAQQSGEAGQEDQPSAGRARHCGSDVLRAAVERAAV